MRISRQQQQDVKQQISDSRMQQRINDNELARLEFNLKSGQMRGPAMKRAVDDISKHIKRLQTAQTQTQKVERKFGYQQQIEHLIKLQQLIQSHINNKPSSHGNIPLTTPKSTNVSLRKPNIEERANTLDRTFKTNYRTSLSHIKKVYDSGHIPKAKQLLTQLRTQMAAQEKLLATQTQLNKTINTMKNTLRDNRAQAKNSDTMLNSGKTGYSPTR